MFYFESTLTMAINKLLFVINDPNFFLSHRLPLAEAGRNGGFDVHIASRGGAAVKKIEQLGFIHHTLPLSRSGRNPLNELATFYSLWRLFRVLRPDLVHLVTIKPYLYGGIAARIAKVPCTVSAVAGLGILFSSNDFKYRLLRAFLYPLYRIALGHENQKVIFQNKDDRNALVSWGVVSEDKPIMIRGSGVDLQLCPYQPEPVGIPVIAFAARLLIDKGVKVFAEASRILKKRKIKARFWLIGVPDPGNPNTVTEAQLKQWESEGSVELFGFRADISDLFSQSNIVTLPSFYGEGLPKVLVEAAACGRAVVTTDHPGCRDAIETDKTGLLVPNNNPLALADSIEYLIRNPDVRQKMGESGRALAEKEYAIEKIVEAHMNIYQDLLSRVELN